MHHRNFVSFEKDRKNPTHYTIYVQDMPPKNYSPREELRTGLHSWVQGDREIVEEHYLIQHVKIGGSDSRGKGITTTKTLGISHTPEELPDKTYECVKKLAREMAQKRRYSLYEITSVEEVLEDIIFTENE